MKETRRVLCAVMAALVILTAPMTSYTEARAADVVLRLGGVALKDILIDCLITAGITAVGGYTIHEQIGRAHV